MERYTVAQRFKINLPVVVPLVVREIVQIRICTIAKWRAGSVCIVRGETADMPNERLVCDYQTQLHENARVGGAWPQLVLPVKALQRRPDPCEPPL